MAGGKLVIVDMLGSGSPERERACAIYALHLALRTEHGNIHSLPAIHTWMRQAGLLPEEVIELDTPPGLGAVVASR
jgi:hypothetical protein